MRLFLFLSAFYIAIIAFGMTTVQAENTDNCMTRECIEANLAADGEIDEAALMTKIENLIATIQEKVGTENIHATIKKAAQSNPQIADLLVLVQSYGVLTDINLDEPAVE